MEPGFNIEELPAKEDKELSQPSLLNASSAHVSFAPQRDVATDTNTAIQRVVESCNNNKDEAVAKIVAVQKGMLSEDPSGFMEEYGDTLSTIGPPYHDLVAAADAIVTNHFLGVGAQNTGQGLLTHSNWASLAGLTSSRATLGMVIHARNDPTVPRREFRRNLGEAIIDLSPAGPETAHWGVNVASNGASTATGTALDVAGGGVNILGALRTPIEAGMIQRAKHHS